MGFSITSTMQLINPVYGPLMVTLDSSQGEYLEMDVYIGDSSKGKYEGDLRTLRFINNYVNTDIQNILQPFFVSDVSSVIELKRIDIVGKNFDNQVESSIYLGNYYIYNGILKENYYDYNYILNGSTNGKFLNNYNSPINIHNGDKLSLYFLGGIFYKDTSTSSSKIYDVSTSTFTVTNVSTGSYSKNIKINIGSYPKIYQWKVDVSSLVNDISINNYTRYYTICPSNNINETKTINIVSPDLRYTPKRVQWIDSNGVVNGFNFDLVKDNTIFISKNVYNNNGYYKYFNSKVIDKYRITSNWITESESLDLKDLWISPSIYVDGIPIKIQNKSIEIKNGFSTKLMNYTIEYELLSEYITQN